MNTKYNMHNNIQNIMITRTYITIHKTYYTSNTSLLICYSTWPTSQSTNNEFVLPPKRANG